MRKYLVSSRFILLNLILYILITVCSGLSLVYGLPDYGLDTLAGVKYPGQVSRIPRQFGVQVFAETFGDAFKLVKKELYAGRTWVGVHFIWSDTHTFGDRDIPVLKRLAKKYAPLCNTGRLYVSPTYILFLFFVCHARILARDLSILGLSFESVGYTLPEGAPLIP